MNPTLWAIACSIGGAILIALAIAYRRVASRRELELAEEVLAAELDALRPPDSRAS